MDQIGRYRVLGPLGRGAMGVVYLAEDPLLNRQVAIKTVDLAVEDESERSFLRDRLLKDARAAAGLAHPGIVSVHDVLEEGDMAFLVMQYIAGDSLSAALKKAPRPEIGFTLRVLREMAAALDYTHARGIVHRDIKPANVMIDRMGAVKIMDFGIARIADTRTNTPTGMVMGTVQYMAPEQVKGEAVDGRADQFALAAVAYEMLTGETLFGQHTLATLAYKIVNEAPVPVRQRNGAVPPEVDAVMVRALSKSPGDRFPSCGMFAAALERAFTGPSAQVESRTTTLAIPRQRSSRTPVVAGLLGATVLGGAIALWHPWAGPRPAPPSQVVTAEAHVDTAASALPAETSPAKSAKPVEKTALPPKVPPPAKTQSNLKATAEMPDPVTETGIPSSSPAAEALEAARKFNQNGQTNAALQSLEKALALQPKFAAALVLRGEIRQKEKQWEAAAADYTAALRVVPRHANTHVQLGACLVQMHRDDLAMAEFNKAIEIRPETVFAYNQRGLIFSRRQDYPKAIADFSEAIRLAPNAPMAYDYRASARRASGDRAGAREDMRRFQELKAGNEFDR